MFRSQVQCCKRSTPVKNDNQHDRFIQNRRKSHQQFFLGLLDCMLNDTLTSLRYTCGLHLQSHLKPRMYSLSIDKQLIEHCIWYDFEKFGEIPGLKILGDFDIVDDLTLTMIVVRGVCFYPKRQKRFIPLNVLDKVSIFKECISPYFFAISDNQLLI